MKTFLSCLLVITSISFGSNITVTSFSSSSEYTLYSSKALITSFDSEYRLEFYKPWHKQWSASLGGKISPDYDIFGNEIKTNVFTTIGVDF